MENLQPVGCIGCGSQKVVLFSRLSEYKPRFGLCIKCRKEFTVFCREKRNYYPDSDQIYEWIFKNKNEDVKSHA